MLVRGEEQAVRQCSCLCGQVEPAVVSVEDGDVRDAGQTAKSHADKLSFTVNETLHGFSSGKSSRNPARFQITAAVSHTRARTIVSAYNRTRFSTLAIYISAAVRCMWPSACSTPAACGSVWLLPAYCFAGAARSTFRNYGKPGWRAPIAGGPGVDTVGVGFGACT